MQTYFILPWGYGKIIQHEKLQQKSVKKHIFFKIRDNWLRLRVMYWNQGINGLIISWRQLNQACFEIGARKEGMELWKQQGSISPKKERYMQTKYGVLFQKLSINTSLHLFKGRKGTILCKNA